MSEEGGIEIGQIKKNVAEKKSNPETVEGRAEILRGKIRELELGIGVTVNEDYVAQLRFLQEHLGLHPERVYVPNPSSEFAVPVVFNDTNIVMCDEDGEENFDTLKNNKGLSDKVTFNFENPQTFNPGEVDMTVMINSQLDPTTPAQAVTSGGYFVCNNFWGTAEEMMKMVRQEEYVLHGVSKRKGEKIEWDEDNLEECFPTVSTDDELRKAPSSSKYASYAFAADIVEQVTGMRENVVEEYNKIIEIAIQQELEMGQRGERLDVSPIAKVAALSGSLQYTFSPTQAGAQDDRTIILRALPPKKGTGDELFVFRKNEVVKEAA